MASLWWGRNDAHERRVLYIKSRETVKLQGGGYFINPSAWLSTILTLAETCPQATSLDWLPRVYVVKLRALYPGHTVSEINSVIQHSPSSSSSSSLNQSLCCCPRWSGWWHYWCSRHCRMSAACGFGGLWPGRFRSLETQDPRSQELLTLPLPLPQDLHPNSHTQGLVAVSH